MFTLRPHKTLRTFSRFQLSPTPQSPGQIEKVFRDVTDLAPRLPTPRFWGLVNLFWIRANTGSPEYFPQIPTLNPRTVPREPWC